MESKITLPEKKKVSFSKFKLFFYIFAGLIFAGVIFYFAKIKNDLLLLIKVKPLWLGIAITAQLATYMVNSIIIRTLLRKFSRNTHIRLKELFQAGIVTLFINQTIPSVQLSGNIYFFNFLKKKGVAEQDAYSMLLFELLSFYMAVIAIILLLMIICLFWSGIPGYFTLIFLAGILAFGLFAFLIGLLGRGKTIASLLNKLSRIRFLKKSISKAQKIPFAQMKNPWRTFGAHFSLVFVTIAFHACIFLLDSFTVYSLFKGMGLPVSYLFVFIGLVLTKIISLLPFTPGSLILYEGSMTFFYVHLGVPLAIAAVVTLLYRVLSFWLPIPAGFFLYRKLHYDNDE